MRRASLRWRISALFGLGALLLTGLLTGLSVQAISQAEFSRTQASALTAVQGVSEAFAAAIGRHAKAFGPVARSAAQAAGGAVYWLQGGRVLAASVGGPGPAIPSSLSGPAYPEATFLTPHGTWTVIAAAPLGAGLSARGEVILVRRLAAVQRELTALQRRLWAVGLLAALLFALLGFLLARSIAGPLERLTLAARRMSEGHLGQRVPPQGQGEVAVLSRVFNDMAARLAALDALRRGFVADAAHELRTPVAGIEALAESLLQTDRGLPGDVRDTLQGIAGESERLGRLVTQLLELAKLDNPDLSLDLHPLRLGDCLREALWVLGPAIAERHLDLRVETGEVWVLADPDWLLRAVLNVLQNAVRHSSDGEPLDVSIRGDGHRAEIVIADRGPGVPAEDLGRLGERFGRLSPSRERATGGAGLGLAIARDVLRRHQGDIAFRLREGGGLEVSLVLPETAPPGEL